MTDKCRYDFSSCLLSGLVLIHDVHLVTPMQLSMNGWLWLVCVCRCEMAGWLVCVCVCVWHVYAQNAIVDCTNYKGLTEV